MVSCPSLSLHPHTTHDSYRRPPLTGLTPSCCPTQARLMELRRAMEKERAKREALM